MSILGTGRNILMQADSASKESTNLANVLAREKSNIEMKEKADKDRERGQMTSAGMGLAMNAAPYVYDLLTTPAVVSSGGLGSAGTNTLASSAITPELASLGTTAGSAAAAGGIQGGVSTGLGSAITGAITPALSSAGAGAATGAGSALAAETAAAITPALASGAAGAGAAAGTAAGSAAAGGAAAGASTIGAAASAAWGALVALL